MTAQRSVDVDELLIFGYSCRLFRDDEKALYIDQGGGLVPWMGQHSHLIDRYDGRGHLTNLTVYEATEEEVPLSMSELQEEQLCDSERYRALNVNEIDHLIEEEEKEKRGKKAGAEIAFSYDAPAPPPPSAPQQEPQLSVRTLANCIEKTAEFINRQGPQMEILMRTKEANNPKFQFLNPENPYHGIYRSVLKTKQSRPKNYIPNAALQQQDSLDIEKSVQILAQNLPSSAPCVGGGVVPAAPTLSSDNAFSKLVERIKAQNPTPPQSGESTPTPPASETPPPKEDTSHIVEVVPPPITAQPLIDKTASYVARKGSDSLPMLKKFEPEKFTFLNPTDKYHHYYQYKLALYKEMIAEEAEKKRAASANGKASKPKTLEDMQKAGAQMVTSKFPTLKGFFN